MNNYYNIYAENELDKWMPSFAINEAEERKEIPYPVKDAPKVKGYFGFISIKFAKRCKDIKKMCVEYINTYVDSCLNVAKNMDDVKLEEGITNLATELNYGKEGLNTDGKQSADNKMGVAFLAGEKSLKDKLQAIINKIKIRASKNKLLQEWASLMIEESKVIANDIVFQESNKLIKDESVRKKIAEDKKIKDERKKQKDEIRKRQEEQAKKIEEQTKSREQLGNFDGCNQGVYATQNDVVQSVTGAASDFDKPMSVQDANGNQGTADTDANNIKYIKQNTKLYSSREEFYVTGSNLTNWKAEDVNLVDKAKNIDLLMNGYDTNGKKAENGTELSNNVAEILNGISNDDEKAKVKGQIANFLYAFLIASKAECDVKADPKSQTYPSPVDLMILKVNSQQITTLVKKQNVNALKGVKEQDFQIGGNVKGDSLIDSAIKSGIAFDKSKFALIAGEWISTFADDSNAKNDYDKHNVYPVNANAEEQKEIKANESHKYVMSSSEFFNEKYYNRY